MRTAVAVGLAAVFLLGFAHRSHAWTFQWDDDEHERDMVSALRVGPGGDLYVSALVEDYHGALFKLAPATGETIWRYDFGAPPDLLYDSLNDVTTDAADGLFTVGSLNFNFDAVRVDPATGQEVWHTSLDGSAGTQYDAATAVAVDGFGGVMVVGGIQEHTTPFGSDFAVVRLDAATGAVLWKTVIDGGATSTELFRGEYASGVAIASNGDAIAVGNLTVRMPGDSNDDRLMAAMRFARDDGHEIWRWTYRPAPRLLGENRARQVVLDAAGDVILSGARVSIDGQAGTAAVFKLGGATGAELWRYLGTDEDSTGVAVDGAGDVLVAGTTHHEGFPPGALHGHFTVSKLSGATGGVLWHQQLANGVSGASQVVVNAAQDVIAIGSHRGAPSAVKLAGSDGHVLWSRQPNPLPAVRMGWSHLALDGSGHVFAGGATSGPPQPAPEDLYVGAFEDPTGSGVGCGNGTLDLGETCDDGNVADFDGCDATCTVEHCGDGVVDPDEQCDDGGHVGGDGCDAQCNYEGCGDGEVGPGEECDDGNRTAGDICSPTCQIEICDAPNIGSASQVTLRKLGGVPGDERLAMRTNVTYTSGTPYDFALIVDDLGAAGGPLLDLSYRTNALGGITLDPGCDPRLDTRRTNSHGATYRNRSNTLPPTCTPGSAGGFSKMTVKPMGKVPGQYAIKVEFRNSPLPTPVGPLRATIVIGANAWTQYSGSCWQSAFTPSQCMAVSSSTFRCQ